MPKMDSEDLLNSIKENLVSQTFNNDDKNFEIRNECINFNTDLFKNEEEEEEEGEIKDEEVKDDFDLLYQNESNSTDFNMLSNTYIDKLIKEESQVLQDSYKFKENFFNDCLFTNIDFNLNDIDENDLVKCNEIQLKDQYEIRDIPTIIDTDTETGEDSESIEEIQINQFDNILDQLLQSKNNNKNKSSGEKIKKGRIVDKNTELEYLIPADLEQRFSNIYISVSDEFEYVGDIIQRIEGTQTMTMKGNRSDPILDLDTIVCNEKKQMIGMIDNIFGTKKEPLYLVICKDINTWRTFQGGERVYCAPNVKNAYFTAVETNEISYEFDSDIAFSDDEKEMEHRKKKLNENQTANDGKRKRKFNNKFKERNTMGPSRGRGNGRRQFPPQCSRNPFGMVNMHPFGSTPAPQIWNSGVSQNVPRHPTNNFFPYQSGQPMFNYPPPPMMMTPPFSASEYTSYEQFRQQYPSSNQFNRKPH